MAAQNNDNRPPPSYDSIYGVPGSTEEFDLNSTPRISVISESSLHRKFLRILIYIYLGRIHLPLNKTLMNTPFSLQGSLEG